MMYNILLVDDNETLLYTMSLILKKSGYTLLTAKNGDEAMQAINNHQFELVILDYKLPGKNGIEILKDIKSVKPDMPVIMVTAFGKIKDAVESIKQGAVDYITKPFNNAELLELIKKVIFKTTQSNGTSNKWTEHNKLEINKNILGYSKKAEEIYEELAKVAPTDLTVVLHGESGSGKEIVANIIHGLSKRSSRPFVAVDCGAIPESLLESELFGFEKGAFTDAKMHKAGRFEQANGGTIFLDEISNLSGINQTKLLRVIESKQVSRLGSTKPSVLDVRIITASNANLMDLVAENKFRQDLFYRLNEYQIEIPPLRERVEDISYFVNLFVKQANIELNKNVKTVSRKIMSLIESYNWPGNLRELRNAVRKSVLKEEGDTLSIIELPHYNPVSVSGADKSNSSFEEISKSSEANILLDALKKCKGNKTEAAKMLNMNIRTFYRRLNKINK